jgi:hypothetical protein
MKIALLIFLSISTDDSLGLGPRLRGDDDKGFSFIIISLWPLW